MDNNILSNFEIAFKFKFKQRLYMGMFISKTGPCLLWCYLFSRILFSIGHFILLRDDCDFIFSFFPFPKFKLKRSAFFKRLFLNVLNYSIKLQIAFITGCHVLHIFILLRDFYFLLHISSLCLFRCFLGTFASADFFAVPSFLFLEIAPHYLYFILCTDLTIPVNFHFCMDHLRYLFQTTKPLFSNI